MTRKLLIGFVAGAVLASGVLASLKYLIDPYDYFGLPTLQGVNAQKPFMYDYARLAKPMAIVRRHPEALILGGSTVEGGLDPTHQALAPWPSAYNAALPSGRFYESYRMLQHALSHGNVKLVIVSLDFINWAGFSQISTPDFQEAALATRLDGNTNTSRSSLSLRQFFNPKFIADGLITLSYQDSRVLVKGDTSARFPTHWYLENGQRVHDSSIRYGITFRGFDVPFRRYMQNQQRRLRDIPADNFFPARVEGEDYFSLIQRFVKLAAEEDFKLMFLIPPCHVSILETYVNSGVWGKYGIFKERIVEALDAAERSTGHRIPAFDFCVYAPQNSEKILSRRNQMEPPLSYWDPVHLSNQTGSLALSIMFGQVAPNDGFGTNLRDVGGMAKYMTQDLSRRETLRRIMSEEFSEYSAILSSGNELARP